MTRINRWLGNESPLALWLDDIDLAYDTARLIADKPASITPIGKSAQTVRIEFLRQPQEVQTAAGEQVKVDTLVLGYKSHPVYGDTNLIRGDRFAYAGQQYEVIIIEPGKADGLHAYCKARN
jgi:hypothetical protein